MNPTSVPKTPQFQLTLRPRWFISRGDCCVPLIAADELPPGLDLKEAPRQITLAGAGGMKFLGEYPRPKSTYTSIKTESRSAMNSGKSCLGQHANLSQPDTDPNPCQSTLELTIPLSVSRTATPSSRPETVKTSNLPLANQSRYQGIQVNDSQSLIHSLAALNPEAAARHGYKRAPTPPSGVVPDESKKTHCTHWIRTGECDYTQKGCIYKHEMPPESELYKFGFRNYPRWWKDHVREKTRPTIKLPTKTCDDSGRYVTRDRVANDLKARQSSKHDVSERCKSSSSALLTEREALQTESRAALASQAGRSIVGSNLTGLQQSSSSQNRSYNLLDLDENVASLLVNSLSPTGSTTSSDQIYDSEWETDSTTSPFRYFTQSTAMKVEPTLSKRHRPVPVTSSSESMEIASKQPAKRISDMAQPAYHKRGQLEFHNSTEPRRTKNFKSKVQLNSYDSSDLSSLQRSRTAETCHGASPSTGLSASRHAMANSAVIDGTLTLLAEKGRRAMSSSKSRSKAKRSK